MQGTVSAGPTCPVERIGSPCPPRPVAAEIDAIDAAGRPAGSTRSAADGTFGLALAPGTYTLTVVTGSVFPRCPSTAIVVPAAGLATANIACDTGIR